MALSSDKKWAGAEIMTSKETKSRLRNPSLKAKGGREKEMLSSRKIFVYKVYAKSEASKKSRV